MSNNLTVVMDYQTHRYEIAERKYNSHKQARIERVSQVIKRARR